jgi:hypothetical protein
MITKFKIFEDNTQMKVGDYVLIHTTSTIPGVKEFINNNIGVLEKIEEDKNDMWGHVRRGNITIRYDDVPDEIIGWFTINGDAFYRQFDKDQVVTFGKTPEEVEIKISSDKYNL